MSRSHPAAGGRARAALLLAVLAAACSADDGGGDPEHTSPEPTPGDPVGVPQPVPIPGPDRDLIRATGAPSGMAIDVNVLGLPGAVDREGQVIVENPALKETKEARSTAAGTFSLLVPAREKDVLRVRFVGSDEVAELEVHSAATAHLLPPPGEAAGVPPLTVEAGGTVLVRGEYVGGPVIGVNLANGATVVGAAPVQGRFELRLPGASGDELRIYGDGQPLTDPWTLKVP
jgi:hypothetical protein